MYALTIDQIASYNVTPKVLSNGSYLISCILEVCNNLSYVRFIFFLRLNTL